MKISGNTILITGGSAGIGLATAKLLLAEKNTVIITGRDQQRLDKAVADNPGLIALKADVSSPGDVAALVKQVNTQYPQLNILINNAGYAEAYVLEGNDAHDAAAREMETNYLSVLRLTDLLLPALQKQAAAAIVNVSSIVVFAPSRHLPTYSASKAALHSYTQSLRVALSKPGTVKVFELMPPLVNTDFSKSIGGEKGIPAAQVANDLVHALESDIYEIHVGQTADLYKLFLSSPDKALAVLNSVE